MARNKRPFAFRPAKFLIFPIAEHEMSDGSGRDARSSSIKVVLSVPFAETRCVPEISALALTMSGPPITSSFSNVRVRDRSL